MGFVVCECFFITKITTITIKIIIIIAATVPPIIGSGSELDEDEEDAAEFSADTTVNWSYTS